jgi:Fe-S-cluster-containing dehydrogenase component
MKKYVLKIDHESCWGCKTCEVACKQENHAADGVKLIHVSGDGPQEVDG